MKLFTLSNGQNIDNHAIQRRASFIIFNALIVNAQNGSSRVEEADTDISMNYEDYQKLVLSSLDSVIINSKLTGTKTSDMIKNFTATEILKISQTLGFPVLVKSRMDGILVSFALPLTLDRSSLPFSSQNTLYLSVKNGGANRIDVYVVDSPETSTDSILRYEREILQSNQLKDYVNVDYKQDINNDYVIAVMETIHEVNIHHTNGEVCQYLPEEFDVLNDFNSRCQLVWNNEQHSNFGNMTSIPMYGVRKIAVQGVGTDQNLFFVRNVKLK